MDHTQTLLVGDILVLPFFGQGHLNPCVELCKHLSSINCNSIFIIPSHLSSSIPSNLHQNPLIQVLEIPASYAPSKTPTPPGSGPPTRPVNPHHRDLGEGIKSFLSTRPKPGCVIMDVMMSWSEEIFSNENIPVVTFFTSGACASAVEYGAWKAGVGDLKPGETRILPGLPECMAMSYSDRTRIDNKTPVRPVRPGGRSKGGMDFGPLRPGQPPRWMDDLGGWTAILLNTCHELEGVFLEYLTKEVEKPVLGVGPLLPDKYWKTSSVIHDRDSRPDRESNYKEEEVIEWLDTKPARSVLYVSFGSEVGPTMEEYAELEKALEESKWSFIWVIQPGAGKPSPPSNLFGGKTGSTGPKVEGYYPHGLSERINGRGLIVKGWAPQLSILSHPSTGGFLSHCGWNSTVESIGRGVPLLTWPIRGDQFYNAHLLVKYLKVGHTVLSGEDLSEMVKKSEILSGMERLMGDKEVQDRADNLKGLFEGGYPSSSKAALKTLIELISK